jgi:hypothetical protein
VIHFFATYGRIVIAAVVCLASGAVVVVLGAAMREDSYCDPVVLEAMRRSRREREQHQRQRP